MGKRNYVRPLAAAELFTPNEFVASCTESASSSPDGEYIYGWVMKCESIRSLSIEGCPDETFYKQDGGTVPGIFIRSNNQAASQQFGETTVAAGYTVDEQQVNNTWYWIITDPNSKKHAVKVQGSYPNNISYPYSYRFNVNLS